MKIIDLKKSKNKLIQSKRKPFHSKNMFAGFLLTIFVTVTIFLIAQNVSSGARLAGLEAEEILLSQKNDSLSLMMFEKTSLLKIQESAEELGYTKPQDMMYIQSDDSVAAVR